MNKNLAKNGIFKAYDIRGRYPEEINEKVVGEIATALADYWTRTKKRGRRKVIVIGYDARLSSPALYKAALRLLAASVYSLIAVPAGLCSTPMLYFLVNHHKAAGGIMITASHNPPEYNGMKVVKRKAEPMGGEEIRLLVENEP